MAIIQQCIGAVFLMQRMNHDASKKNKKSFTCKNGIKITQKFTSTILSYMRVAYDGLCATFTFKRILSPDPLMLAIHWSDIVQ